MRTLSQPVASNGTDFAAYHGAVAPVAVKGPWKSVESVPLLNQSGKVLTGILVG